MPLTFRLLLIAVLTAVLLVGACASDPVPVATTPLTVRVPAIIQNVGGVYVPWNAAHTIERHRVLACTGIVATRPHPTIWIAASRLFDDTGREYAAVYDRASRAIVFNPALPTQQHVLVFAHEILHHDTDAVTPGLNWPDAHHPPVFWKSSECNFWPVSVRSR